MALLTRFPLTCKSVLSAQPLLSRLSSFTDVVSGGFNAKAARMEPMETEAQVPHPAMRCVSRRACRSSGVAVSA